MLGTWTERGFWHAFDGRTLVVPKFDGFEIVRDGVAKEYKLPPTTGRQCQWGPDSKHFIFPAAGGMGLVNVENPGQPGGPLTHRVIYAPPKDRRVAGAGWDPAGGGIYVNERFTGDDGQLQSEIKRLPLAGGAQKLVYKHPSVIEFFMSPVQRFEDGSGPTTKPYHIAFGAREGLFTLDPQSGKAEKFSDLQPAGIEDVIWQPNDTLGEKLVLMLRRPQMPQGAKSPVQGVLMVHFDRAKKDPNNLVEVLYNGLDVHSLWFSFKGKYLLWATGDSVSYRETFGKETVKLDLPETGPGFEVKGVAMNHKESEIAVAIANKIWVYDVAKKKWRMVTKQGEDGKSFIAQPFYTKDKDDLIFTVYSDVSQPKRRGKTPR